MKKLYNSVGIKKTGHSGEINGRDGQKMLHYIRQHENDLNIPYKSLFLRLEEVEVFAKAKELTDDEIETLETKIIDFINLYEEKVDHIEKTHILKYHLLDFVNLHRSWGLYSEQGR